jgi:hypothetical protein
LSVLAFEKFSGMMSVSSTLMPKCDSTECANSFLHVYHGTFHFFIPFCVKSRSASFTR